MVIVYWTNTVLQASRPLTQHERERNLLITTTPDADMHRNTHVPDMINCTDVHAVSILCLMSLNQFSSFFKL